MPTPKRNESRDDFVSRCIPIVLEDGTAKDQEQAAAVCFSMWKRDKEGKTMNELKAVSKTDDELRAGNYIVLFGGRDLEGIASPHKNQDGSAGEYFTPDTDLESAYTKTGRLYVDWEHGYGKMDHEDAPDKDDVLGYVDWKTARKDERGVWVERVLSRRNEYMRYLETLIEEGIIGTSSEAIPDKTEKGPDGEIKRWPLRRDTLTVNPMEPRMLTENAVTALKALAKSVPDLEALLREDGQAIEAGATETAEAAPTIAVVTQERKNMDDKEQKVELTLEQVLELARKDGVEQPPAEIADHPTIKAIQEAQAAIQKQLTETLDLIAKSPALKDAGYTAPDSEADHAEAKSFGDFLVAVRQNNRERLKTVYKAALAEGSGATGGYLVPVEFGSALIARSNEMVILRQAGAPIIPIRGRSREIPVLDVETAPSAGSTAFAGGVVGYWMSEAAAITESEPSFRLIELVAHKLAAYSLASSEVRDDAAESLDGLLAISFAKELAAQENYAHFRGDGVGKPLGILNSSAWSAQTRSAASAVALADLAKMEANFMPDAPRGIYVMNPGAWEKVVALVSNPLAFLNTLNEAAPRMLLGRRLFIYGGLPALNTAGDVMLVDPEYYLIGNRAELSIAFSEHFKFQNDQLAWRVIRRCDGQPWVNGVITLENASTTISPFVGLAAG